MPGQTSPAIRFGPFEANLAARELRKNGVRLKLQDQPFRVLQALLEKPGEVVTREELQERIWGDDTYVDFDKSLSAAIGKVREALDDSRTRPRYIETIPKVGYRFIHPLDEAPADDSHSGAESVGKAGRSPRLLWALAALALIGVAAWLWMRSDVKEAVAPVIAGAGVNPAPLTTSDGREDFPTFSPDGSQVAYAATASRGEAFALYVRSLGSEDARTVTGHDGSVTSPAWSPDGSFIAYILRNPEGCELRLIPPVGGASRLLAPITCLRSDYDPYSHLSWSPDSRYLAYSEKPRGDEPWAIFLMEIATRAAQRLTQPPAGVYGDDAPSFAWEKRSLAFIRRSSSFYAGEIRTIDLDQEMAPIGESRAVSIVRSRPIRDATSVIWDRGDEDFLILSGGLWRVPSAGGSAAPLLTLSERLKGLAITRDGRKLAFVHLSPDVDVWRYDRGSGASRPLLTSTHKDWFQSFSPDGRRIAWNSERSGFSEIWVSNADGADAVQLTRLETQSGAPVWSPDGKRLAFDTRVNDNGDIYLIDSTGGAPQPLTTHSADDVLPSWSADGRSVYFMSRRDGEASVWSIDIGSGETERVSKAPGGWPKASPDGRFVYFRGDQNDALTRLYRKRLDNGEEDVILDEVYDYQPAANGVYFVSTDSETIRYFNLDSSEVEDVLKAPPPVYRIAVSSDEQTILFTQSGPDQADIMLVEGFE